MLGTELELDDVRFYQKNISEWYHPFSIHPWHPGVSFRPMLRCPSSASHVWTAAKRRTTLRMLHRACDFSHRDGCVGFLLVEFSATCFRHWVGTGEAMISGNLILDAIGNISCADLDPLEKRCQCQVQEQEIPGEITVIFIERIDIFSIWGGSPKLYLILSHDSNGSLGGY